MLNPKHLWVICRVPCIHNILVISHHLMLFHGSPSPSSAITFLNVIWFFCPLRHKRRSLSSSTTCLLEESCPLKQIGEQWQPDFAFLDLHLRVGKNNTPGELPETGDSCDRDVPFIPEDGLTNGPGDMHSQSVPFHAEEIGIGRLGCIGCSQSWKPPSGPMSSQAFRIIIHINDEVTWRHNSSCTCKWPNPSGSPWEASHCRSRIVM